MFVPRNPCGARDRIMWRTAANANFLRDSRDGRCIVAAAHAAAAASVRAPRPPRRDRGVAALCLAPPSPIPLPHLADWRRPTWLQTEAFLAALEAVAADGHSDAFHQRGGSTITRKLLRLDLGSYPRTLEHPIDPSSRGPARAAGLPCYDAATSLRTYRFAFAGKKSATADPADRATPNLLHRVTAAVPP